MEITFGKPYWEDGDIREFDPSRDDAEFVWHRDKEDREIEVLEGEGWQFQYENCMSIYEYDIANLGRVHVTYIYI